jgi:DNA-binding MarR family transcriptional regulator
MSSLDLVTLAHLLGSPSRIHMLTALEAAGELSASALAQAAGVTPQAASAHLKVLKENGLIIRTFGNAGVRQHMYSLTNDEVARAVRALVTLAKDERSRPHPPKGNPDEGTLCYRHLGGPLGHALLTTLLSQKLLEIGYGSFGSTIYLLTREGERRLAELDIDVAELKARRRNFACPCRNAAKARTHLAGALGQALTEQFLARGWLVAQANQPWNLKLSPVGRDALLPLFGLQVPAH